jgi:hypothetical protein
LPAIAVTITADGWLTDIDLGDPDLRPDHLRRLIGCAAVHPIALSADLLMWAADAAEGSPLNAAATDLVMTSPSVPNRTIYGTVVLTGGLADNSEITPIPDAWAQHVANHHAVQPVDAANPTQ